MVCTLHRVPKIISGDFRTRILLTPEGEDRTRPMTARVKESVFAMLHGWFAGARVLDLFAGVGTVGLECVSRGAAEVVMVERDRDVFRYLEHNIETLKCRDRAIAIQAEVPLAEMFGYVTALRTLTSGRASSTMEFSHYAAAPTAVAENVMKNAKGAK